jgi:hypothetical protein
MVQALDGMACVEPVPWGDQFTLDYNLESTFWGAGSSNRIEFIHPVMASSTNPGAVATAGDGMLWLGFCGCHIPIRVSPCLLARRLDGG